MPLSCTNLNSTLMTPNSSFGNLIPPQGIVSSRESVNQPRFELHTLNLQDDKLPIKDRNTAAQTARSMDCLKIMRSDAHTSIYQAHYNDAGLLLVSSNLINGYLAIEILRNGTNTKVGSIQEVKAKYFKNKILKYLRVPRDDRPRYYLSRYEIVRNDAKTGQTKSEVTHRIERVI